MPRRSCRMEDMERGRFDRLTARTWDLPVWQALARAHGSVLELGCGTGRVLRAIEGVPGPVCGVEMDPERVQAARSHPGAHVVSGDIRTVRLERRFALVIVACNTLSLFEDPSAVLRTAAIHLRPGGVLAFDLVRPEGRTWGRAPHRWAGRTGDMVRSGRFDPSTGRHVETVEWPGGRRVQSTWYRSRKDWERRFRKTGFRVPRWIDEQGREPDADSKVLFCTARLAETLE